MAGKETSLEGWESVRSKLESFGMLDANMEQFLQDIIASSGAFYSEKYLSDIGVSNKLYAQYQDAVRNKDSEEIERFHKTFAKWRKDYNIAQSD
jgi:P2-related tail formation protein